MSKSSAGLAAKRLLTHRALAAFFFGIWEEEVAQVAEFVEAGGFHNAHTIASTGKLYSRCVGFLSRALPFNSLEINSFRVERTFG